MGTYTSQPAAVNSEAIPMVDLKRQYESMKEEVHAALERVLATQHFIGGTELEAFERESAAYLGVGYSVGCASGTDALWLALQAAGIGSGVSVVTTPFSFFASMSSIVRAGALPVLADLDPATLNLDPAAVENALRQPRFYPVHALLPVHLYGQACNMDEFEQLAHQHGLQIIEDAAQAFGAKWKDRKAGTLGKAAAFSFYPTKNLSAYGDAGSVTTNDEELAKRVRSLRNHGSRRRYYHEEIGANSRLDAVQAAVLRVKLTRVDSWNQQRRILACRYHGLLAGAGLVQTGAQDVTQKAPIALLATVAEAYHNYHQYVVRAWRRDELRNYLAEKNISTEVYYPLPLHLQACFAYLGYKRGDFPEAERAAEQVIALPMFPELREDEQQRVVATVSEFYNQ